MTAVAERTPAMVVHDRATSPNAIVELLRLALDKGLPVEALERLQALHERVSDRAAAIEFAEGMARFQSTCPPIQRTSTARILNDNGVLKYSYTYAELDEIATTIAPHLRDNGLSYTWDSETVGKDLKVTCILRHVNGHSVAAHFSCPIGGSSGMSEQQKHASTLTYARRQSLVQVLGLTTTEPDSDGQGDLEPITEAQAHDLEMLITETGGNVARFLAWAKVESLKDIPAKNFDTCIKTVRAMEAARAKGGQK